MRLTVKLHRSAVPDTITDGALVRAEEPGPHADMIYDQELRDDVTLAKLEILVDGRLFDSVPFVALYGWPETDDTIDPDPSAPSVEEVSTSELYDPYPDPAPVTPLFSVRYRDPADPEPKPWRGKYLVFVERVMSQGDFPETNAYITYGDEGESVDKFAARYYEDDGVLRVYALTEIRRP